MTRQATASPPQLGLWPTPDDTEPSVPPHVPRPGIPRPEKQPTMQLWPEVGQLLGLGRAATYEAARRGDIPIIRFGRRIIVPTAALRRLLGVDPPSS